MAKNKVNERLPCPYLENTPFVFVNNDSPPKASGLTALLIYSSLPCESFSYLFFSLSGVLFLKVLRLICLKFFFLFVYDSFPYCSVRFFLFLCGYDCSLKLLLAIVEINALLLISSTRFITSLSIFLQRLSILSVLLLGKRSRLSNFCSQLT